MNRRKIVARRQVSRPLVEEEEILFTVGLIADPQYVDKDDGYNYRKTRKRYYRTALKLTENAVNVWNDPNHAHPCPSLIVCLGDTIDGFNKRDENRPELPESVTYTFLHIVVFIT